ncbi:MAG: TetR/AcrR family transcriptional regulator [Chryseotalea sp.]
MLPEIQASNTMQEKKDVKEIIIKEALHLFNTNGFVNVRLQHIADAASISVGHMAYHYKNKDAILHVLYALLNEKQRIHLAEFRVVPLFEDIDRQITSTFHLQQEYIFFYQDMLEIMRGFPTIKNKHQQQIEWQIKQIQMMIDFNIARGVFHPPVFADLVLRTAQQYWAASEFWCYQQSVVGLPITEIKQFRESVWSVLKPMFTHVGQVEFNQLRPSSA